ncbi:MAG: M48 family metalloprotease [Steroidobacteraceae bacterium]
MPALRRLFSALLACGICVHASLAASGGSAAADLPDIGTPADSTLTRTDELQLGRMVVRGLRDQNEVLDDPEVTEYIQSLGQRLAAQTGDDNQQFQYFVVKDRAVNAFALPGGFVGVNAGLILLTNSESELASVLGHETAHVKQRHIARAIQAQGRSAMTSTAALLAALLIGAATGAGGDAMMGAVAMSQGMAMQQSINFTRSEEAEADRVGITLLAGAGFDTTAMANFFETMGRSEGVSDAGPLDLLRSHPVTRERIAEARARAAQYPRVQPADSPSYELMRERVRVLSATASSPATRYYAALQKQRKLSTAERYGQALAELQENHDTTGLATLRALRDANPQITPLYGALGQALLTSGDVPGSLQVYEQASKLFPRNVPLTVRYSEALMQAGQAQRAHELLLDLFNNVEPTPDQIRLTALAASAAGDPGDAYYYMGEYHISGGDLQLAMQQLELALAAPNLTDVQRQRFRARLDDVRGWVREQRQSQRGGDQGDRGGSGRG